MSLELKKGGIRLFGMSMTELILILAIALVVLGPDRLPGFARAAGRAMREFRKASREIQASLQVEEVRRTLREQDEKTRKAQADLATETTSSKPPAPVPVGGVVKSADPGSQSSEENDKEESDDAPEDEQRLRTYLERRDRGPDEGESSLGGENPQSPPTEGKENGDN